MGSRVDMYKRNADPAVELRDRVMALTDEHGFTRRVFGVRASLGGEKKREREKGRER